MSKIRKFETGATRDTEEGKIDYEGFLSPKVLWRFGQYMYNHQVQADGKLRASDNWQKGIPHNVYMKSAWRHFMDWWYLHRDSDQVESEEEAVEIERDLQEALCALMFNVMGYLHELLKD